ncbi:MAG: arylamine N-acetyltransferase [Thermomicrobiales bacterium]
MVKADLDAYRQRIGYPGHLEPTAQTLRSICRLHQLAIPFENLDIALLRRPISLEPEALVEKLVHRRRGGFCFEQNGLLAVMLEAIGFGVTMGYATWVPEEGERIVPFDHLVLKVELPEDGSEWLADVGFGRETPEGPLPLQEGESERFEQSGIAYRLRRLDQPDLQWAVEKTLASDGEWTPLYDVDLRPRRMEDYEARSLYNQTSPESHFTQGVICSKPVPGGRVSVTGEMLIVTMHGERQETPLQDISALIEALDRWFGVRIEEGMIG